jgi:heterotetrameric sarcosine oxidase gamma subunit
MGPTGALAAKHQAMGATMTPRGAARFGPVEEEARRVRESVGLADGSWIAKLDLKGADASPVVDRAQVCRLARGHWLLTYDPQDEEACGRSLQTFLSQHPCARTTDVTSVLAALILAGPAARSVLERLATLNAAALPDGACAAGALAHVAGIILRRDLGPLPAFWLLFGREYAEYLWDAAMHAGHSAGIVPFGLDTLEALR